MTDRDTVLLIRNLKGAPSTILLMMLGLGRPTGRNELALLTAYSENTVAKALAQLEFLGLAQSHSRYNGWELTSRVRQQLLPLADIEAEAQTLPLDDDAAPEDAPAEVENVHLPAGRRTTATAAPAAGGGRHAPPALPARAEPPPEVQTLHLPGSSSYPQGYAPGDNRSSQPTTTTQPPPDASPDLDDAAAAAVDLLRRTGCPLTNPARKGARDAVLDALAAGWTGDQVLAAVRGWFAYADSPEGRGIQHKGFLTLSKIRRCEPPPDRAPAASRDQIARDAIAANYARIVQH